MGGGEDAAHLHTSPFLNCALHEIKMVGTQATHKDDAKRTTGCKVTHNDIFYFLFSTT